MSAKDKIIADLGSVRAEIVTRAQKVPAKKRAEIFLGKWSVQDLLAHFVRWDYANMDSVNDIRDHKTPRVFQHFNPDWSSFNAQLVRQYKQDNWGDMLAEVDRSHRALIAFLQQIPPDDFEQDFGVRSPRGRKITIAAHLQAEIDDERKHLEQIEHWLNSSRTRNG